MRRTYEYPIDYSIAALSIFDLGDSLHLCKFTFPPNGTQYDNIQLINDLKVLEEDYRNACQKITENQDNRR